MNAPFVPYTGQIRYCAQIGCVAQASHYRIGANGRRMYLCGTHAALKGTPMLTKRSA